MNKSSHTEEQVAFALKQAETGKSAAAVALETTLADAVTILMAFLLTSQQASSRMGA